MYIKAEKQRKIIEKARDIKRIATLETCGISELVDIYNNNDMVRLWFKTWIERQAADIEEMMME